MERSENAELNRNNAMKECARKRSQDSIQRED
jgi:hypothetical protein